MARVIKSEKVPKPMQAKFEAITATDKNYKRTFLAPRHWWIRRWGRRARHVPRAASRCCAKGARGSGGVPHDQRFGSA